MLPKRRKIIKVRCSQCDEWFDEENVKFMDIEEGMQGEDILTFECPNCKTKQRSRRYG